MSQDDESRAVGGADERAEKAPTSEDATKPVAKKVPPKKLAASTTVPPKGAARKAGADKAAAKPLAAKKAPAAKPTPAKKTSANKPPIEKVTNQSAAAQAPVIESGITESGAVGSSLDGAGDDESALAGPPGPETQVQAAAATADVRDPRRPTGLKLLMRVARPRASRGQLVVALLCGLLGFALVTQVHSQAGAGLSSARQADLVDVLDNLSAKSEQLRSQISDEQNTLSKLTGGSDQTQAALQEAEQRATTLRILAGTVGASGPGIDLHITDPDHKITADVMLNTLEELRDAGAEAVEIRGATSGTASPPSDQSAPTGASGTPAPGSGGASAAVRLVASSYFVDSQDGQGIIVDGTPLLPPYDLLALGDPPTLSQAMGIPGGVLDSLKSRSAHGTVTQLDTVRITALHVLTPPKYARPAASP